MAPDVGLVRAEADRCRNSILARCVLTIDPLGELTAAPSLEGEAAVLARPTYPGWGT